MLQANGKAGAPVIEWIESMRSPAAASGAVRPTEPAVGPARDVKFFRHRDPLDRSMGVTQTDEDYGWG